MLVFNPSHKLTARADAQPDPLFERVLLIGNAFRSTPVVPLRGEGVALFAKLEGYNPFGSIKDRVAYWILRNAIERREVNAASTIVESSSGNFAIALASICRFLGLRFLPVIDPNTAPVLEAQLRNLTKDVIKVDRRDDTGGFLKTRLERVRELRATIPGAYWPDQYGNEDGLQAHYLLTGGEICEAFESLDYAFIPVSTAGTLSGVSRRLKEKFPGIKIVGVDVVGSVIFGGPPKTKHIPGLGSSIRPRFLDRALTDDVAIVPESDIAPACQRLLRKHGVFVGGSSGAAYAAACSRVEQIRREKPDAVVLFLCPDRGFSYLDSVYDANWNAQRFGVTP